MTQTFLWIKRNLLFMNCCILFLLGWDFRWNGYFYSMMDI